MSEINYQALREAAVAIETVATPQKLLAFRMKVTPQVVLALLDERERNQQYIKRRDQENEDIALTVGKLRVELEAAEKRIAELESLMEPKLPQPAVVDNDKFRADFERWMVEDEKCIVGSSDPYPAGIESRNWRAWNACRAAMLQSQDSGIKDSWISCSERMPPQDDWILIYSKHGEYMAGQVQGEYVELSDGTLSWLGNALFWMPLPEPPQEVK
ncbi:ead/Ea22-like family protein [Escherichia coli]|nr:ead/Ea22-like family protein [Escherichia coli]MCF3257024.1 ead/Ea22-like family protein [Escherichia coli]